VLDKIIEENLLRLRQKMQT